MNPEYSGEFLGVVVNVSDPERRCRVQVRVWDVFDDVPDGDLPWAIPQLPLGCRANDGGMIPVKVGDQVCVDFPFGGDTRRPRFKGSAPAAPGGVPNLTGDLVSGTGKLGHKRTPDEPPVAEPNYYEDVAFRQNGILFQATLPGALRFTHVKSGTAIEITPDGDVVIHGEKNLFFSAGGNCLMDVKGNYELRVGGNMTQTAKGSGAMQSAQSMSVGSTEQSLNLAAATQGSMSGPGGLTFEGPSRFSSNVDVGGDVNAGGSVIDAGENTNHHSH